MKIKLNHDWVNTAVGGLGLLIALVLAVSQLMPKKDDLRIVQASRGAHVTVSGSYGQSTSLVTWYASFYNYNDRPITIVSYRVIAAGSEDDLTGRVQHFGRTGVSESSEERIRIPEFEVLDFYLQLDVSNETDNRFDGPGLGYWGRDIILQLETADGSTITIPLDYDRPKSAVGAG